MCLRPSRVGQWECSVVTVVMIKNSLTFSDGLSVLLWSHVRRERCSGTFHAGVPRKGKMSCLSCSRTRDSAVASEWENEESFGLYSHKMIPCHCLLNYLSRTIWIKTVSETEDLCPCPAAVGTAAMRSTLGVINICTHHLLRKGQIPLKPTAILDPMQCDGTAFPPLPRELVQTKKKGKNFIKAWLQMTGLFSGTVYHCFTSDESVNRL